MKPIKLADRSELGWGTAIEYEQDDLASGYEDEKRMQKSERAAERKLKVKRRKFGLNRPTGSFFNLPLERRLHWARRCHLALELAHVLR